MIDALDTETQNLQRMWDRFSDASSSGVGGAKTEQSAKKAVKEATTLLNSDSNVRMRVGNIGQFEPGTVPGRTGSPELDEPASLTNISQNLERLLLYLQLDNDERQIEMTETRLEGEKNALETKHNQKAKQIEVNIESQDAVVKQQKAMKIFSWAMVAVSVAVAIATCGAAVAALGAAGGAAAGGAAAGGAAAGTAASATTAATTATTAATTATTTAATTASTQLVAAQMVTKAVQASVMAGMGLTFQTLNETGVTEKATEAVTDLFESMGLSKQDAQIAASVGVAVFQIGVTVGGGFAAGGISNAAQGVTSLSKTVTQEAAAAGTTVKDMAKAGSKALSDAVKQSAQNGGVMQKFGSKAFSAMTSAKLQVSLQVGSVVASSISVGSQTASAITGYESAMSQADTTELNATLQKLQQMVDETSEELNELLAQVENLFGRMAGIIDSAMDTEKEIATNMGNMA